MAISAGTVAAALTLDTGQFDGALAQSRTLIETFSKDGGKFTDKLGALGSTLTSVGAAATMTLTTSIAAAGTAATKTFTSFDDAMRQVRATMSATDEDAKKLTDAAKKYGAETRYTASQSAEALNYLALAGYDADQAITALPTVLRLAQAGGMELAYTSDLVTDSMSALGLEMDQLTGFSDQLAVTSQKSNTNIAQLGQAILTVGGTAKALAGGTVELNAELGILADAGIKSAEGGTHLRNVILSLQTPTEEGARLIAQYTQGVYDAEGRMRSLDVIFGEMRASMSSMTDAERQNVISGIFNKTDLAAVEALLSGCGERFTELTGYIEDSAGAAQQMADTMEGGIGGVFRSLSSAVEAVGIAFGETMAPDVQWAAECVTGLARGFANLDEGMRSTIVRVAGVAAAAGPVLIIGGKIMTMLSGIGSALAAGGAIATGPVGWIGGAVVGLAAIVTWARRATDTVGNMHAALAESNAEGLEAFNRGMQGLTEEVDVDVKVNRNYADEASTLYEDIYTWLTDGQPDTEAQKKEINERVQSYFDELLSEINLDESSELAKLQKQYDNGFIDYDTFLSRSAEVRASAEAARTELGTLCDESLAFIANYAGKPAGVVQEAFDQIDALEQRTDALLKKVGLANDTLETAEGDTAVKLTKAGATGDVATYGNAFNAVAEQRTEGVAQAKERADAKAKEINALWEDAYGEAEKRGDEAAMQRATQAKDRMIAEANAEREKQIAALDAAYVQDFSELFAGIAQRFPEQAAALEEAMAKIDLADKARELWSQPVISPDDITDEMIAAMGAQGIDFKTIIAAAAGDETRLQNDLHAALRSVMAAGDGIDIAGLLTETLSNTELGTAFEGVIQGGLLEGVSGIDTTDIDAQLALITGHMSEYLGTSFDGASVGATWTGDVADGITAGAADVQSAGASVGAAGAGGVAAGGINAASGSAMAGALGNGLVSGLNAQEARVRAAAARVARAATGALRNTWEVRSPSRVARRMANMYGEGIALGIKDEYERVRSTMIRISDPTALGVGMAETARISVAGTQRGETAEQPGRAGNQINITVPGARITSENEAKQLLSTAARYINGINRGVGR